MSVRLTPGPQPSDRFGLEAGVDRQLDDAQDTRARLRWGPVAKMLRNPRYAGMVSYAGKHRIQARYCRGRLVTGPLR